jgi:hypothetical protein
MSAESTETPRENNSSPAASSPTKKLILIGIPAVVILAIAFGLTYFFVTQSDIEDTLPTALPTLSTIEETELLDPTLGQEDVETPLQYIRPELSTETLATIALNTTEPFESPLQEESFFNENIYRVYVIESDADNCPTDNTNYKFYKTNIQETAVYPIVSNPQEQWGSFVELKEKTPVCIREKIGAPDTITSLSQGSEVPGRVLVEIISETKEDCLKELNLLEPEVSWTAIKIENEYGFCLGLGVMVSEEKIVELENSDKFVSVERDTIVSIQ